MPATASTTYAERVDRERRAHERTLFVYLLARLTQVARHAISAARHGLDPAQAAQDAILGNERLKLPGIADGMESLLGEAFDAGWRRAGRTAGLPDHADYFHVSDDNGVLALDREADARAYAAARAKLGPQARSYATSIAGTIGSGLRAAVSALTGVAKAVVAAVRSWFRKSGYVNSSHPEAVKPGKTQGSAVTHGVSAYNQGNFAGNDALPTGLLLGYRDVAVLDDGTTEICEACDEIQLPPDHPFWVGRKTPRHFRCRTILEPIFRPFVPTPDSQLPWHLTSAPGFGYGGVP